MSERPISTVQLGLAAAPVDLTFKNLCNGPGGESRSSSVSYCPLCVCVCVYLQVVGLDADQRPLSRRSPAGESQGSQPGGAEGPEGRPGSAEGLGRKLPGEYVGLQ